MTQWTAFATALAIGGTLILAGETRAQDVENFYKGRTVQLQVGFGAGGGNDLWARALARHMSKHIPGKPVIVVSNMPAAGSLALANYNANVAPRDGSMFATVSRSIPFEKLLGGEGVQFDPLEMTFLGSPSRDGFMCAVGSGSTVKTANDLVTKSYVMGATGAGDETFVFPSILKNMMKADVKIVTGYKGSQEILLAVERGELDGLCLGTETVRRTSQYAEGKLKIVLQMATDPDPVLGNLPMVTAYAKTPEDRAMLDLVFARVDVGRPFIAPPGVPKDRLAALRAAFMATMKDPEFKEDVAKMKLDINAIDGEQLEVLVRRALNTPDNVVKRTIVIMGR